MVTNSLHEGRRFLQYQFADTQRLSTIKLQISPPSFSVTERIAPAATLFTLTNTCNRLHIDPFAYLQDVYARLPTTSDDDLESLLPDRWLAQHPQHQLTARVQEAHDRALRAREKREERRRRRAA